MLSSCIAAFLACTAFIINDLMTFRHSMEREVSILAQVISSNSSAPLIFDDRRSAEESLSALSAQPHVVFASIYNQNGKEVARYVRTGTDVNFVAPSPQGDSVSYVDNHMHMFRRIILQGEMIGTLYLKYDLEEISSRRNQYLEIAFIILLAASGLSMALSSRLQRVISSPVLHLADVAAAVSNSKDYSLRAEKIGQDEIGNLIDGFNEMLAQVQDRDARLEQYAVRLEEKVELRTAELWSANKELKAEMEIRALTEQALASEKERLAVTLRSIGDGVIVTDINGTIVLASKMAEELTGWSQEDALGRPLEEVFHVVAPSKSEMRTNLVNEVLNSGRIGHVDSELLINKSGNELVLSHTSSPVRDHDGQLIGVIVVFRDITEKQKVEDELLRSRKLESIGVLAGGIAHDFNNFLTAVLGNISIAKMQTKAGEKIHHRLADAEKACYRARDLTKQLLTYSKGGAPVKSIVSLAPVLRDSTGFTLAGSNVRCNYEISDSLWLVEADAGQISQIINNLMINACQAMPEGGVVGLKAENVTLDGNQASALVPGRYVKITVTDQGNGIPEENLQKIFDPYFTTKEKGSGLGLATCYSIAKRHGGLITVESKPGCGTTFFVFLPVSHKNDAVIENFVEVSDVKGTGKGRVLLLDDDEMVRDVASEMLRDIGYDVQVAEDGVEAIEMYKRAKESNQPFCAAIMDLTIPGGMGGGEVVQRLSAYDANLKAIVSSGYAQDPIMADYMKWGFCGVIAKPYSIEELSRVLSDVTRTP